MAPKRSSHEVLVVDDDPGLGRLIQKALLREGFQVTTLASGKQAISWLSQNKPSLMLLDLKLQDIEGRELIGALADIGRPVPFIIITGQGDERTAVDMMKRGALDYLVKDVDFIQFVPEVVRRGLQMVENEQKLAQAKEALRETEARFRLTADHAPVLIWMSGPDKLCTWFNRPWLDFTGRTLQQELGNGWTESVHPEDLNRCLETYSKAFAAKTRFSMEYRLRRHDGEWCWVFNSGLPLCDTNGGFTGYIGSCIDISERKRLEREVLEISEREQRRIGQDLHDGLGQQLTAIELMCEAIRMDPELSTDHLKIHLARVCKCIRQAIGQTRSLAQGLASFNIETIGLASSLDELARNSNLPGSVKCSFEASSMVTITDKETANHLYRIAQEAVNNALKHSSASKITIELSNLNSAVRLQIKDNGKGLPKGQLNGGMGLNVMKHRASAIGADLDLKSRLGKGVTVTCKLPKKNEK